MEFVELTIQEYDTFARKHPYRNFLNSANAFKLKSEYGFNIAFVGVKENHQILAATGVAFIPVMRNYTYLYAQRGYLIDYDNLPLLTYFHEQIIKFAKAKGALYVKLDPYVALQERDINGNKVENGFDHHGLIEQLIAMGYEYQGETVGFSNDAQARWSFVLDLQDKTPDMLLKEMDHQTRWSVNKTIKQGIKVRELSKDELPVFKKMMDYAASTRNFQDMSLEHYILQLEKYGADQAKIMISYIDVAEYQARMAEDEAREQAIMDEVQQVLQETPNSKKFIKKQKVQQEALELLAKRKSEMEELKKEHGKEIPLAGAYFILYEDELVYVSSGAYDEFRNFNGPYAIQWHMLQYALSHGIKRYNFYGISGVFDESASDYGVFNFKKGFNGVVEELVGEFILPIDKVKYKLYKTLQKVRGA